MPIKIYEELEQGSQEWMDARCGVLTASEMKLVVTKTLKKAANEKLKAHMYELAAQRITGYVEPCYISDDMLRGWTDEEAAKEIYNENYAKTKDVGFITNDKWGFTLGCSPDALIARTRGAECKSRRQRFQIETITNNATPEEFMLQIQTSMMVSERKSWEFISYSAGLPMYVKREKPDPKYVNAIEEGARDFHAKLAEIIFKYEKNVKALKLIKTERPEPISDEEIVVG